VPASAPPRAGHWVAAGGLFAASLFLLIVGLTYAALGEDGHVCPIVGRGALVLSVMTCTIAATLCNRICQTKHAAESDAHMAELLMQLSEKVDGLAVTFADLATRVDEFQWDVFGEAALAASGASVTPMTRRPIGRDRR
jgi:hypothetical protein